MTPISEPHVVSGKSPQPRRRRPLLSAVVHGLRIAVFVAIVLLIHFQARKQIARRTAAEAETVALADVAVLFPAAGGWGDIDPRTGARWIVDADGRPLGVIVQTSPQADHIVGFSGPTNLLVGFDHEQRIIGVTILWSRDTREHVQAVLDEPRFLASYAGQTWERAASGNDVDAVSGATLTSLAIAQSIVHRLGGEAPSFKFPAPLTVEEAREFFPDAHNLAPQDDVPSRMVVTDANDLILGQILRTSPAADNIIGYQGPTEALLVLDPDGLVLRMRVRDSYDNQPYVGYLNEDWSFPELFAQRTLSEVAEFDLEAHGVEGVSGATMTSLAVARGVIAAAQAAVQPLPPPVSPFRRWRLTPADLGTLAVLLAGIGLAFTRWRGITWLRTGYQLVLIGYVGLVNGDLLSQAMLVGWARNGVPWQTSLRLVLLAAVAVSLPILTRRNVYCTHLCPHGAVQQLIKGRLPVSWRLGRRMQRLLSLIPAVLLTWVVLVAMLNLSFSLVDIEPFDAYLFRIAGWSTIGVAVVGVVGSLFVPMAYCRFGCPTGAVLGVLRRHSRSDLLTWSDLWLAGLLGLAVMLFVTA